MTAGDWTGAALVNTHDATNWETNSSDCQRLRTRRESRPQQVACEDLGR